MVLINMAMTRVASSIKPVIVKPRATPRKPGPVKGTRLQEPAGIQTADIRKDKGDKYEAVTVLKHSFNMRWIFLSPKSPDLNDSENGWQLLSGKK